ncbi:hypothetical protein WI28_07205 [Burkholderia diffusa]|nr:hypothetical protein WI28_07205 [Burkholderia diffusa]
MTDAAPACVGPHARNRSFISDSVFIESTREQAIHRRMIDLPYRLDRKFALDTIRVFLHSFVIDS